MASQQSNIPVSDKVEPELERGTDVWTIFSPASGYMPKDSLSLGQGFMNWLPPRFMRQAVTDALEDVSANHYSVPRGRIRLRNALADHFSANFRLGRRLDPDSEVLVSPGANMGIFAAIMAFCSLGDEVIMFEPFFDQYVRNVTFSGGTPVYVPLRPPPQVKQQTVSSKDWKIDINELKAAITPKTKIIILNTPHNPVGKVFDKKELEEIGRVAVEHNLLIIADEVYDCITFHEPHISIASLSPSLWDRTVTVGSAGKSFSATGWRIGWCFAPAPLIKAVLAVTTRTTFCAVSPLQEAVATGLELANKKALFETQRKEYQERRDVLLGYLDRLGLPYTIPDGAYFVLLETCQLEIPKDFEMIEPVKSKPRDWQICWFIAKQVGVVCIPASDFYSDQHQDLCPNYVRIAFCKDLDTIKAAGERFLKLKPFLKSK